MQILYDYEEGEKEEHRGVKEHGLGYSTYEHCKHHPGFGSETYCVTTFIEYSNIPNHVNRYVLLAEELDDFFYRYHQTSESVVDIRPISVDEAVELIRDYDEDVNPWGVFDE
jgi:hypothetical protein